ncbi:MAG: M14 family metallopeptidase, partial [Salinivenus sp.]
RMEDYVAALTEAAPDRTRHIVYGQSVEGQDLHLLAIGSAETIGRLDSVRSGLQRLADPAETSQREANELAADLPVAVWINSANDGNETAAFESVMQVAYQLTAGQSERARRIRENTLVLLNMAHNPESHERFVAWYNAFGMGDAAPKAYEHDAPWGMNTNNNHFQIDLNRDGVGLTQTESRAVSTAMQRWRPQVFVDLHGQTTQYFFPPNAAPINPLFPDQLTTWIDTVGQSNARAFDRYGWSYYTRDVFDLHYPGYWDSYPSLHGATGMTYETDGGGGKGLRWRRGDGTILTFEDGIAHHFVAVLSTIDAAARNREARLRDYHQFFADAMETAEAETPRGVVLEAGDDPRRAARLATTLLRHGVEVERITQSGAVQGYDVRADATVERPVSAGSFFVPFAQPDATVARMLLLPDISLPEGFRQQELARLARNLRVAPGEREPHAFYDVTAWNLAIAGGVPALWTDTGDPLPSTPLSLPDSARAAPGGWAHDVAVPTVEGGTDGRAQSAYVWTPESVGSTRLVARLMDEGFAVAVVDRPMVVGERSFPRGSYIARVGRNPDALHARIDALAETADVPVHAANTAFAQRGPTGTGSETTRTLTPPDIAVLAGDGVSTTSYGAFWYVFQQRLGQPFTALRTRTLSADDLEGEDVLVMPNGDYGALSNAQLEAVRRWVERGGTVVGYAGGAEILGREAMGVSYADTTASDRSLAAMRSAIDAALNTDPTLPPTPSPSASIPEQPVPGAFLRARADTTHWLTYGMDAELALLSDHTPLTVSVNGANPVTYAATNLEVSGFAWPALTEHVYAEQPYATVDRLGDGRVIRLAEDPLFRVWADGPMDLLTNAIYLGGPNEPGSY